MARIIPFPRFHRHQLRRILAGTDSADSGAADALTHETAKAASDPSRRLRPSHGGNSGVVRVTAGAGGAWERLPAATGGAEVGRTTADRGAAKATTDSLSQGPRGLHPGARPEDESREP